MSSHLHKISVAFSVTNCICHDQRVLKIAETVSRLDCDVAIIGRKTGECCNTDSVRLKTRRFRMIFKKGFLFYAFFNIRLFFLLLFSKYDLLVSNDLDTLLPNFLVSKLRNVPLVYDSHEYFTGVPEIQNRRLVKWVWKRIERIIFPRLKYVMTVSNSIAELYDKEYEIRPLTVRNCSDKAENIFPYSRTEIGVDPDHLLLILQGTGINVDRGGEELIDAVNITERVSLLIVGSGDLIDTLKRKVRSLNLNNRVKFFSKVPWEELLRYTRSADTGISLDKNNNINYLYSLPNKLFDYIAAGIPVIASDLPEIKKIIVENRCGIIVSKVNPENISEALAELRDNKIKREELRKNAVAASEKINWEIESRKVKELYSKVISENRDIMGL